MNHYATQWIEDWCQDNGWTDWFIERSKYWAFPPNAVMPMPIPTSALRSIKREKGFCLEEQAWGFSAVFSALLGAVIGYWLASPMPLVAAFAYCAVVAAQLEDEEV